VNQEYVAVNGTRKLSPQEIADALRERIRAGELKAGDRLPTQAELAGEFDVERGSVRQALRMLQEDGLLTNVSKGSPPKVADPPAEQRQPQAARVALASYLREAFQSSEVRIDAVCFTAETLLWALVEMHGVVGARGTYPDSVRVRCLLPGPAADLSYPKPVDRPDLSEEIQRELKAQIAVQKTNMESHIAKLGRDYRIDATVEFRWLPDVYPVKHYVLNDMLVLQGYYTADRYPYELSDGREIEVEDVRGLDSPLFEFRHESGGQAAEFVRATKIWFDALWDSKDPRPTLS
jgi:DNA-binding transcriptional regulator YhcF (GntR family)